MLHEEVLLGTIMKEPHLLLDTDLKEEYFQVAEHKAILKAMKRLQSEGKPIDFVTLITKFPPEQFGGAGRLNAMMNLANPLKFDDYHKLLLEQWREREKTTILEWAKHEDWEIERIIDALNKLNTTETNDHATVKELVLQIAESPWTEQKGEVGINTGVKALQEITSGFKKAELIILAARPSMGKTDVALNIAKHAGWNGALPIFFSLEMKKEKLNERLVASIGKYNRYKMKNPYERLSEKQKATWIETLDHTTRTGIHFFDKSAQTLAEMRMKIRKVQNENPDKDIIVIIDYLTLIKPANDHKGNMHLAVSDISKGLKTIAKDFNCPVVCLAQLSRSVEKRNDKRPMLSDLRESGSIEEDADVVIFLYRESYYDTKKADDQTLEMIIAKNRDGEVGTVTANYNKFTGVLSDI